MRLGIEEGTMRIGLEEGTMRIGIEESTMRIGIEESTMRIGIEESTMRIGIEEGTMRIEGARGSHAPCPLAPLPPCPLAPLPPCVVPSDQVRDGPSSNGHAQKGAISARPCPLAAKAALPPLLLLRKRLDLLLPLAPLRVADAAKLAVSRCC